ncbi:MAG: 3-isopropylmalate dehydratase [Gammaproteobacteria bacterium]|nr:3-isopropylmalate dehydratase [Gammaproteobacteria bacterium]
MSGPASLQSVTGTAWVFGDDINTDVMAPGLYFKSPLAELAQHCLEAVDPGFAPNVQAGDVVVAGDNFGIGSAREQAAMAFQHLGVGAILARSFGRIFYRNALNFGIPTLAFPQAGEIRAGDELCVDPAAGRIDNVSAGRTYEVSGLPPHLLRIVSAGGLMPYLKQRLAGEAGQ